MIWRIIKKILSLCRVEAHFREGDIVKIKITLGSKVILDKEFDLMPGV